MKKFNDQEKLKKIRFLMKVFRYDHTHFVQNLNKANVTIEDLYDFVVCDEPLSKRSEFYAMFEKEKYADTFWRRFVDSYLQEEIRKEIEYEKYEKSIL